MGPSLQDSYLFNNTRLGYSVLSLLRNIVITNSFFLHLLSLPWSMPTFSKTSYDKQLKKSI